MISSRIFRDDVRPDDDRGWTPQRWGILFVLGGALCLDALDVSMVGVALPSIRSALGLSTSSLQWIVSGYVLGYGGLLLLGGRAADLLGRRRVFLVALAAFAVVSVFGGLVSSAGLLIAARFVKGAAAAFTAPASMSLLTTTFPEGPMRNRAFSIYTVFGASGFSLGLVLSGALTEISWRWTLLVSAPVAFGVLAAAVWLIPAGERSGRGQRTFDVPGALAITAAMLLLVYTVVSAQQAGWGSARTVGSFAGVAVLVGVFAVIERRSRDPLVPFGIFSSSALRRANIGAVTLFGTYISFQFLVTQYLQTLSGWSAMSTALAFLPAGVMVVLLSTRMGSLLSRFGPTPLTGLAFTCLVLAYAVFLRAGVHPDYPAVMLPATLLVGLAFGLGFSSLTVAATAGVPDAEQGLAASLFQTSFQVGGAVVLAIVTAVIDAGGAGRLASAPVTLAAYRPALGLITGIAAIGMLVALSGLRGRPVQRAALTGDLAAGELVGDGADELAAREVAARELAARELAARELAAREVVAREVAAREVAAREVAAGRRAGGELVGCPALEQAADVTDGRTTSLPGRSPGRSGLAVGRDDDYQGRPPLPWAVRVAAASGARPSGGRQDRPGPADVPAGQVAAQPARSGPAGPPALGRVPGELLTALIDQGLGYLWMHDGSSCQMSDY